MEKALLLDLPLMLPAGVERLVAAALADAEAAEVGESAREGQFGLRFEAVEHLQEAEMFGLPVFEIADSPMDNIFEMQPGALAVAGETNGPGRRR